MWSKNVDIKQLFDKLQAHEKFEISTLERIIKNNIGINLNKHTLHVPEEYLQFCGNLKSKQYPNELAQFLAFLYTKKEQINTYLEIGVENCGTFYTIDSYLRSVNPHFRISIAVDRKDKPRNFNVYEEKYNCKFFLTNSADLKIDEVVDLVFIDANHHYYAVKADFEKVRGVCKFVAFHDIVYEHLRGIEVSCFWNQVKKHYKYYEFLNADPVIPDSAGIGVLELG
jgi:hypothetical protein